ncbi:MAG: YbaN family protein [Bacteroidales bacterium]|nr:YbaN family protein [Bacteroidales bacterium]
MRKSLYIIIGIVAVILGIIGIVVPGLPTTPFILLASYLFYQSSERLHSKLNASFLGKYIKRYSDKQGVPLKTKITTIILMWSMISISIFILIPNVKTKVIVAVLGLIGTLSVVFFVPNEKKKIDSETEKITVKDSKFTNEI